MRRCGIVQGLNRISEKGIQSLRKYCPSLKQLYLGGRLNIETSEQFANRMESQTKVLQASAVLRELKGVHNKLVTEAETELLMAGSQRTTEFDFGSDEESESTIEEVGVEGEEEEEEDGAEGKTMDIAVAAAAPAATLKRKKLPPSDDIKEITIDSSAKRRQRTLYGLPKVRYSLIVFAHCHITFTVP